METTLIRLVWKRAESCCEYCRLPAHHHDLPSCIDHIIARKHDGPTEEANLALSCYRCNAFKGDNISGIDPETGKLTRLFHPRRDAWRRHFKWDGPVLVGRTAVGRTTIKVLNINSPQQLELRQVLLLAGGIELA